MILKINLTNNNQIVNKIIRSRFNKNNVNFNSKEIKINK